MVVKLKPEELASAFGDAGTINYRLEQQKQNLDFLQAHYGELITKHPNEWIIVYNGGLVATTSDAALLLEKLDRFNRKDALLYYLADPEDFMIL